MRAMAKAVLEEDDSEAALALADCVIENVNNPGFRYSAAYIEQMEEVLREVRRVLVKSHGRYTDRVLERRASGCRDYPGDPTLTPHEVNTILGSIFRLQQVARQQFQREGV